jgi:hypothetical protein
MQLNDWIGTVGVMLILMAYFLSTFRLISSQHFIFFILNSVGAALACLASFLIHYWPFVVLEGTWTLVSVVGLVRSRRSW